MQIKNEPSKSKLIKRLRRIEGQVRGVQTMVQEERDCRDIMQQLTAIHSAVQSTSRVFFKDYAAMCLTEMDENPNAPLKEKREMMVKEMIDLLDKTP